MKRGTGKLYTERLLQILFNIKLIRKETWYLSSNLLWAGYGR